MWTPIFVFVCVLCAVMIGSGGCAEQLESCEEVNKRCVSRVGCGMAWNNFMLLCSDLLHGETTECTAHCTRALISLLSTDEQIGVGFTGCDCGTDTMCSLKKARIEVCSRPVLDVIRALDDSSTVECNMAVWLCEADASCQAALMYYMDHCESLLQGTTCTDRCNNSLAVLYRHTKGAKLINCTCAGVEKCTAMHVNTDRLCFHKNVSYQLRSACAMSYTRLHLISVFVLCLYITTNFCV